MWKKQEHCLAEGDQEIIFGTLGNRISETELFWVTQSILDFYIPYQAKLIDV